MIHVFVRGRLGNQLFQYAFVRAMQIDNPSVEVVYHFNEVYSNGSKSDGWDNSLKWFNTVGVKEGTDSPSLSLIQRIALKLYWRKYPHNATIEAKNRYQKRWIGFLSKLGLFYLDLGYYNFPLPRKGTVIVSGNFESERYFSKIKDQLYTELEPKYQSLEGNRSFLSKIRESNSICVSIRRGDFVSNSKIRKLHDVCKLKYYERAIDYMESHVSNPVFFFFSDDIEWCKTNFDLGYPCYYESGSDPVWEKLRLMSSCKHFIISNSSFSWWAQYLGKAEDKIVVAPNRWYNSPFVPDIYLDNWKIISAD